MSDRSSPSNKPETAPYEADDDTTDEDSICHECRQVDWDSLPTLAESFRLEDETRTIRTIEANHEQLATSSCKICHILSILKPQSLDATRSVIEATSSRHEAVLGNLGERGERVTVLYVDSQDNEIIFNSKCLVAIQRDGCSSRMITPRWIDYNRLKHLTQKCEDNHGWDCPRGSLGRFPGLKVIDVSSRTVIEAPIGCRYIALSYVWGKQQQVESPEMDLKRPPPLIEDALLVTSSMGYQYLWVDRYCIPTNDDQERHRMISRMDQVYSSASITILDASGEDAQSGLPGVSNFARQVQQRVHIGNTTLLELTRGGHELKTSKWATRGWTYQEGFLSPRRLIFTPSQVLFLCASNNSEESVYCLLGRDYPDFNTLDFKNLIRVSPDPKTSQYLDGPDIVVQLMEYSKRDLTYQRDSLNAFLGVLSSYTQNSKSLTPEIMHISWGLFAQYMEQGELCIHLDWYHKSHAQRRPGFPSWTWAGWGRPLLFTARGITLRMPGEYSQPLRHFNWQLSWDSKDHLPGNIWGLADHVWRAWPPHRGLLPQQPTYISQLQITCPVVPIRFQEVSLTRAQREWETEIDFGNGTDVTKVKRVNLPEESAAVLQICEGVYIAAQAYLDQDLDTQDCIIGLLFAGLDSDCERTTFGCLIARQLDEGLYERVGAIPCVFDYYHDEDFFRHEPVVGGDFLNETGTILDKVRVSGRGLDSDWPFEYVGKRRTIVLV